MAMRQRALIFFLASTIATGVVVLFRDLAIEDSITLRYSLYAIGFCFVYVVIPHFFNHMAFLVISVPLWIVARFSQVMGTILIYVWIAVLVFVLAGASIAADVFLYRQWGAIGAIGATIVIVTAWILWYRYLEEWIRKVTAQIPQWRTEWARPLDQAISDGHKAMTRLGKWVSGR